MALSIKTKIWLPAIAVSMGLVLMSVGSAVRTVQSQAITVKEQSDQQSKLELASRWRGLAEAQALRTLGAALAADEASAALLQGGQEQAQQELAQVQSALGTLLTTPTERAALVAATQQAQLALARDGLQTLNLSALSNCKDEVLAIYEQAHFGEPDRANILADALAARCEALQAKQ